MSTGTGNLLVILYPNSGNSVNKRWGWNLNHFPSLLPHHGLLLPKRSCLLKALTAFPKSPSSWEPSAHTGAWEWGRAVPAIARDIVLRQSACLRIEGELQELWTRL